MEVLTALELLFDSRIVTVEHCDLLLRGRLLPPPCARLLDRVLFLRNQGIRDNKSVLEISGRSQWVPYPLPRLVDLIKAQGVLADLERELGSPELQHAVEDLQPGEPTEPRHIRPH